MPRPIQPSDPRALRNSGWRPPLLPGEYQDLLFNISGRPEYQGKTLRAVLQDAIRAYATPEEIEHIDF